MILSLFLAGLLYPVLRPGCGSLGGRWNIARVQLADLKRALDAFQAGTGRYPTQTEGLQALWHDPGIEGWAGPYVRRPLPPDPWGSPYYYLAPGKHGDVDVWSLGADGIEGGGGQDADICSWTCDSRSSPRE